MSLILSSFINKHWQADLFGNVSLDPCHRLHINIRTSGSHDVDQVPLNLLNLMLT